ncbi:DUF3888 domain-containing protein [Paenisporosarcina indica]|uniref:DUF3888 domain-containing protein n=1 Tax=Paenisporosarcina indica TaxID=650093 RepID=UPI00094F9783|nr:DUF3888 domain-containing protein [Paenisporosarcina indica]
MKKFIMFFFFFSFLFFTYKEVVYENNTIQTNAQFLEDQPIKNELYSDVTVRFISPYVYEAINSHYESEESLTQYLNTSPPLMRIVKVDRVGHIDNFEFRIIVEVTGFVGEKVPVVDGQITFRLEGPVSGGGANSVFFERYKQLKIYELPQEWKHLIKKPLK